MSVSVVIPNYNHAQFLEQRIESVLQQHYADFEVILLDDASTDESRSILERYRHHPKVSHVIYNSDNSGSPFKQWAKGIALAKGEWVWIAESDDYSNPEFLEVMMEGVATTPDCSLACCQSYLTTSKGVIESPKNKLIADRQMPGISFIKERLLYGNSLFNASMVIFKREIALLVPYHYTQFSFCGDWLFWIYQARTGNIFCSCKRLNYYRQHEGNQSLKLFRSGQSLIEELKVILRMKEESLINPKETRHLVEKHYQLFLKKQHLFSKEIKASIQPAFVLFFRKKLNFYFFGIRMRIIYVQARIARRLASYFQKKQVCDGTRFSINACL